ncbi:TNT domain-containing protein [Pectobacterium punjabense]|uniref:TNT domain-containing protein n=1 Tax=Pectobacterium punjabense TaxID=2108399 RepID=UPI0038008BE3
MARDVFATGNKPNLNPTEAGIQQYVYQMTYDKAYTQALNSSGFGSGGAIRQGIMSVSAAVQGLAGGNVAQAPYLAAEIKKATTDANDNVNIAANAVAHAVLIGEPNGSFLAPKGTPYEQRALAPGAKSETYYEYEVIKPLPAIQGKIASAFGQPGGGIQILPNMQERVNVDWLVKNGYLREIK